jgi:hypothetical protein
LKETSFRRRPDTGCNKKNAARQRSAPDENNFRGDVRWGAPVSFSSVSSCNAEGKRS